jgi:AP-3 complex subunit beta
MKTRSALGKALVRIHRDRPEIQYIVLLSIRTLVHECPSAFSPFLHDFFVKGMDPSFTRMIKLDILLTLSSDPKAVETVLTELRTYVRHSDKVFACAAIRAVAKVVELARIIYDRRAHTTKDLDIKSARAESDAISLNCLSGLVMLSEYSRNAEVVGECVMSMQRILSQLWSDDGTTSTVKDSTRMQEKALKRLLLIIVRSLTNFDDDNNDEAKTAEHTKLDLKAMRVPDSAIASSIFIIGEWLTKSRYVPSPWNIEEKKKQKIRFEVMRLLAKQFTSLDPQIKLQAVHLASKVLLSIKDHESSSTDVSHKERVLSGFVLALAKMDVLQDVRDRARYESNVLQMSVGLNYDSSTLLQPPPGAASVGVETAMSMLLGRKPIASSVPLDSDEFVCAKKEAELFRFGTLSNVLCNTPTASTIPLPKWAEKDSPSALRDTSTAKKSDHDAVGQYIDSSEDESSSSEDSSSSSSEDESDESSDDETTSSSSEEEARAVPNGGSGALGIASALNATSIIPSFVNNEADDDESSSESSSGDSDNSCGTDSDKSVNDEQKVAENTSKPSSETILDLDTVSDSHKNVQLNKHLSSGSEIAAGLEDLIMAPLVTKSNDLNRPTNIDDECGVWKVFVRPELSGGLYVKMRFIHGNTRVRETEIMGLDPKSPSTVCLQVHIENM